MNLPDPHFNAAVVSIAARLMPTGYDVSADAPQTYLDMLRHYLYARRICVWSGASQTTIFGDEEVNWAFRAWHDWCHITLRQPFTLDGEERCAKEQCAHLLRWYGDSPQTRQWMEYVKAEVIGQRMHYDRHGKFPDNQMAFVLAWCLRGWPASLDVY